MVLLGLASPGSRFSLLGDEFCFSPHPFIIKPIFIFFFDSPEPSADLANIDSFGIAKRLARPVATRAKNHAISLGVNPFTYGCPFHCDPPLVGPKIAVHNLSFEGPPSLQRVWPFKRVFRLGRDLE
jgi:hypothetical protein